MPLSSDISTFWFRLGFIICVGFHILWISGMIFDFPNRLLSPVASITGLFLGSPLHHLPEGHWQLQTARGWLTLTRDCSGLNYWILATGLLLWYGAKNHSLRATLLAPFLAYGLTVVVNSFRVISSYHVQSVTRSYLPLSLDGAIHLAVGTACFTGGLIFLILLQPRKHYENSPA